jgi:hypothetical protein
MGSFYQEHDGYPPLGLSPTTFATGEGLVDSPHMLTLLGSWFNLAWLGRQFYRSRFIAQP